MRFRAERVSPPVVASREVEPPAFVPVAPPESLRVWIVRQQHDDGEDLVGYGLESRSRLEIPIGWFFFGKLRSSGHDRRSASQDSHRKWGQRNVGRRAWRSGPDARAPLDDVSKRSLDLVMDHMDDLLVIGRIGHLKNQVHPLLEQLMLPCHSRIFVFSATTRKG